MEQDGNDSGAHRREEPSTCQLITRLVGKGGETMGLGCAGGGGVLARGVFRGTWERCNRDGGDRRAEFGDVKLAIARHFEFPAKGLRDAIGVTCRRPPTGTAPMLLITRLINLSFYRRRPAVGGTINIGLLEPDARCHATQSFLTGRG